MEPYCDYYNYDFLCNIVDCATVLGWKHFAYVGHSMGGALGVILSSSLPFFVSHLVLIDSLGPFIPGNGNILESITSALQGRQRFFNRKPHFYPSFAAAAEKLRNNNPIISERGLNLLLERSLCTMVIDGSSGVVYRHDPRLREPSPIKIHESDAVEMIHAIKCPIFIAASKRTAKSFPTKYDQRKIILQEKGVELIYTDGSHHLHLDNPHAFAPQLLKFLNKVPTKSKL